MKKKARNADQKNRSGYWFFASNIILLSGLILSCQNPDSFNSLNNEPQNTPSATETASVVINLPGISSSQRSVLAAGEYSIDQIASYHIQIFDSEGNNKYDEIKLVSALPLTIDKLPIGEAIFDLSALDAENKILAKGSATVTLVAGVNNIRITLIWKPKDSEPGIIIEPNPEAEVVIDIEFDDSFIVETTAQWDAVLAAIRTGGNGTPDTLKTYTIYINGTIAVPGRNSEDSFGSVQYVTIKLKGNGVLSLDSNGSILFVNAQQTLSIDDENLVLQGRNGNTNAVIRVQNGGTLKLKNGAIIGNNSSFGGGVRMDGGIFIMEGGEICDNTSSSGGGGVFVGYGYSNGVYVGGTFILEDGKISGNTAYFGGGVYMYSNGTLTMNGGEISGNTSSYSGGGVDVGSGGTLTMNGGKIFSNTSYSETSGGGGVDVGYRGTFTMSGGEISSNNSSSSYGGGGVCVGGSFVMEGGKISGNTSSSPYYGGGGVHVNGGTFTMNGTAIISGNTATRDGGGVFLLHGTFTMENGEIFGNTSNSYGGGVYVTSEEAFTMYGGKISDNTASFGGGVSNNGTFTMHDGVISGNTANSSYGGGVYVRGTFTKTCGIIYGYSAGDTTNNNVVINNYGTVVSNQGHAVYAYARRNWNISTGTYDYEIIKRKETTIGPEVNLSFDGSANLPTFSGDWDY